MSDEDNYSDLNGSSYINMVYAVNDSNYGILERCPCGSQIMVEISTKEADIGKKYFVCRDFKFDRMDRASKKNADEIAHVKDIIKKL
ncbi:hypothetical protein Bca4012_064494 [Brassica carinata]